MASPFGIYVHVPFCAARCGYCDFNTYTSPALRPGFVEAVIAELRAAPLRPAGTVFFGGGTPTVLPPGDLARILAAIELQPDAEVTVEANPESADVARFSELREAGFTRASVGMQSASDRVLAVLDRAHTPGRAVAAAREARQAGFDHVSIDLIFGAPGETDDDWRRTLDAALSAGPDHVSTYGLTIEPGTRMHAQVRRGELPAPDEDAQARRYAIADEMLSAAGFEWYEISSWATSPAARCHHNLGYWAGEDWYGAGPGAHSHVAGERWWNILHPTRWAQAVHAGEPPVAARETLTSQARRLERLMLAIRSREGIALDELPPHSVSEHLLARHGDRAVLTLEGRLVADAVTRALALADERVPVLG